MVIGSAQHISMCVRKTHALEKGKLFLYYSLTLSHIRTVLRKWINDLKEVK